MSLNPLPSTNVTDIYLWRHGETNANKANLTAGGSPELYPDFVYCAQMTALNEQGREQADKLGRLLVKFALDVIYTSDMGRARDTAVAVVNAYALKGRSVELTQSMQLREIIHGQLDLIPVKTRNEMGQTLLLELLRQVENRTTTLPHDIFLAWKLHPIAAPHQIVGEECVTNNVVDVQKYIETKETRSETPWLLFHRITQEITKIAQANFGKKIGISTHGAALETLLLGLNKEFKGTYVPPYWHHEPISHGSQLIPAGAKIKNCDLLHLQFDLNTNELSFLEKITV